MITEGDEDVVAEMGNQVLPEEQNQFSLVKEVQIKYVELIREGRLCGRE